MCFLTLFAIALAAPDALGLGDGRDGELIVSGVGSLVANLTYTLSSDLDEGSSTVLLTSTSGLSEGDILFFTQVRGADADIDVPKPSPWSRRGARKTI